ncbi:ArsR family transcriptional regulator [Bacillus thuringiensis]|uniref:ArsR family transcriptional regulator n=2 Tax=Bacillus cereus group TaxID=86661 RepID=A0A9X6ZZ85_BACCE|nr:MULTISPECIES: metalloregulator ArsR/SmtB family transcription factor [Bacillus cereus group]AUB66962.1 ArsR family transcriptional regulator [Bacillus cereus]AUB67045.1 ArsR family transcriptional regulator [Bacillus cereus]OUB59022.1 transcriptional regulator [Bacillus thuringiensis serovar jegathesan]PEW74470.1 ArsR family transcriptional regulator [Bacillus thuringiensis]PFK18553.1 ArsR family transcriptional regulator [Bacillus cereus]
MINIVPEKDIDMLKALAHPVRLDIVNELIKKGGCNVSQLVEEINIPQSTVSQHLTKLRTTGIVRFDKLGQESYYRVENAKAKAIVKILLKH